MRTKTKEINFDRYDTLKLQDALKILTQVYNYNYDYDSSRHVKLLDTVIRKLEALINDYGKENEK